jgi:hypothetical protein
MSLRVLSEACRNYMEPGLRIDQWRADISWLVRSGSWACINRWPYIIVIWTAQRCADESGYSCGLDSYG